MQINIDNDAAAAVAVVEMVTVSSSAPLPCVNIAAAILERW